VILKWQNNRPVCNVHILLSRTHFGEKSAHIYSKFYCIIPFLQKFLGIDILCRSVQTR